MDDSENYCCTVLPGSLVLLVHVHAHCACTFTCRPSPIDGVHADGKVGTVQTCNYLP